MRHRILRSTIAVVAVTGLFLGLPLMFYTWRWLDDTARTDLQHRLQRASSEILVQEQRTGVVDEPPVEALRLLVPSEGRLTLSYTDRTGTPRELTVGRGPFQHAMTEGTSLGDAGLLRIEQDYSVIRDDQYRALTIEFIVMVLSLTAGVVVAAASATGFLTIAAAHATSTSQHGAGTSSSTSTGSGTSGSTGSWGTDTGSHGGPAAGSHAS